MDPAMLACAGKQAPAAIAPATQVVSRIASWRIDVPCTSILDGTF